ncbi:hypothetical protein [Trinickia diaoshuihuensis]|uniref:hypothetical protein n=1 Tax=Trinickia diaoshuihuensis TaxID=2292265 RepID=UPI000E2469CB|nr:hypothetical protein [Trinickia diaoshuihuensis]
MRDFLEKCLVFGGIALAYWLLIFDGRSPKQRREEDARQLADDEERRRNYDAAAAYQAQNNRHDQHR